MSGIPEATTHIERQIDHLISADEQFANVEAETDQAVESGMSARKSLGSAREGIRMYTQATDEALTAAEEAGNKLSLAGAVLQDPVGSIRTTSAKDHLETANEHSRLAAEKRDLAIATGTIAVKELQTASAGVVGFLTHTESARTFTAHTMTGLLNAKEAGDSTPAIQETIAGACQDTELYSSILNRARTDLIRFIGGSFETSGAEIVTKLFDFAAEKLEEGIALLRETSDKPVQEFSPAAQAALEKVDIDFKELLVDLQSYTGLGVRVIQQTKKESSIAPAIQEAIQQSRSLLTQL